MTFDEEYFNIGYLDRLSFRDTVIHRLDPRGKIVAVFLFIATVVSYPKYEVLPLMPYFIFPVLLIVLSDTPFMLVLKRVVMVSPFAVFIGIFNPFLDSGKVAISDHFLISAGWISFASIMMKFVLTISAAIILIATTSFPGVCYSLQRLGVPSVFTSQLLFLYRYIFILLEEAMRMVRARNLKSFGSRNLDIKTSIRLIGVLFIRTVERAERIYKAMLARGFEGEIPSIKRYRFTMPDLVFIVLTLIFLLMFRMFNISTIAGQVAQRFAA
jgi:cobalt/nickel transport system permease protein